MLLNVVVTLFMVAHGLAHMKPIFPTSSSSDPFLTLTYEPLVAVQIPPTTTIYKAIMTTYYNVVDCNICTVTNVRAYSAAQESFTAKTTSSLLIITEVGCVSQEKPLLRRGIRGVEKAQPVSFPHQIDPRRAGIRRQTGASSLDNLQLSGDALKYLIQCNTALYALNLVNSGFDLALLCDEFRDPTLVPKLAAVEIDANQAADIICFAAVIGIDFVQTNIQIIESLAATIYGVELGANFTGTTNTTDLCLGIDYSPQPYLGVDATGIQSFICNATSSATSTMTAVGSSVTGSLPTGNITVPSGTGSFSNISTTENSPGETGTGGPSGTGTGKGTGLPGNVTVSSFGSGTGTGGSNWNISFPQTSYGSIRLPPPPQTTRYYPAFATSTVDTDNYGTY